ncbi:MAG: hypothetical protein SNH27_18055, partial [Rikenellaceae bacterium]
MSNTQIIAQAKRDFQKFYNIPDGVNKKTRRTYLADALDNYPGTNLATELEPLCRFYNTNCCLYLPNKRTKSTDRIRFELIEQIILEGCNDMVNLCQIPLKNGGYHIARITDDRLLSNDYSICPHCNKYVYDHAYDRKQKHFGRFKKHVAKCQANGGRIVKEVQLSPVQRPYASHLVKQPIYEFLFAHGLAHLFRPTKSYITYDFETLEVKVDEISGTQSMIHANLIPFMVSSTICSDGEIGETRNFCLDNDENFIKSWISWLFEQVEAIAHSNYNRYFSYPEFVTEYEQLTEKQQKLIKHIILRETSQVPIIGFNSAKFDINLFIRELCCPEWRIQSMIGSSTNHKIVTVKKVNSDSANLKFIDIRCYLAGGTLDGFTQDFGNTNTRTKNFFPYEFVTFENWKDELSKSEPFAQDTFYSSLSNSNISDTDYQTYINDSQQFNNRLEYFKHYCDVDTRIMIEPINNLIDIIFEHKVDMLHNCSLSANASMIRYSKLYTDFDPSATYPSHQITNTFTLTPEYWQIKCNGYRKQDEAKKRPTNNNVNKRDYQYFKQLMSTANCCLCGEAFSNNNPPSLDRIDNSQPHTKENVQLTCAYCNKYKSDKDEKLQKLRINLRKYALLN